jgi:hypothetical protein
MMPMGMSRWGLAASSDWVVTVSKPMLEEEGTSTRKKKKIR